MAGAQLVSLGLSMVTLGLFVLLYIRQELYMSAQLSTRPGAGQTGAIPAEGLPSKDGLRQLPRPPRRAHADWEAIWEHAQGAQTKEEFMGRIASNGLLLPGSHQQTPDLQRRGTGLDRPAVFAAATNKSPAAAAAASPLRPEVTKPGKLPGPQPLPRKGAPPRLTKELAESFAHDNVIIVTWANDHFADFVFNWVHHIKLHGITNYLVGAMDHDIGVKLTAAGIQSFAMYDEDQHTIDGLHTGAFIWGGEHFHKMGRQKIGLAKTFTDFGLDLMLCDVDVVWIKDPTDYFNLFPEADVLTSSDELHSTISPGDTGLEMPEAAHAAMNIGLMFFRHSAHTAALIHAWNDRLEKNDKLWDQEAFNNLVREGFVPFKTHPANPRLFAGYRQTVWVGILPVATFASGHTYFVQDLYEVNQVEPYVVHTTFQYGGPAGKLSRLRERNLWKDNESYFQGRFVTANLSVPEMPRNWDSMETDLRIAFHKMAMESQLMELKQLFLLAVALDRTVIVPRLTCFCDRYWGPVEQCKVPGAFATRLPFTCPMDHILEPFHMDDAPDKFGVPIKFREYSFLERTPSHLRDRSLSYVKFGTQRAVRVTHTSTGPEILLPQQFSDVQAKRAVADAGDTDLVLLSDLGVARGRLEAADAQAKFIQRLQHVAGVWCCQGVRGGYSYAPMLMQSG